MNIRNLLNKDVLSITNCESEPIHIPGSIQPNGFLLGISPADLTIHYCSQNCEEYFNVGIKEILGNNIAAFFKKEEIESFTKIFQSGAKEMLRPFVFLLKGIGYNCITHISGQFIILEFEPFSEDPAELPNLYILSKRFTYFTEKADNLQSLCDDIANETRSIIGFDRVMIYRFDEQYNGEVFAESSAPHLEPFLNLHYPHTDIPVQARELYLKNLVRLVEDVNYIPVPLFTFEEAGRQAENLDLGNSFLRSVSPIHVEYLKNMGVSATFVISLIHNNKLWGLISCHHYTPKNIPYYKRLAAHLQAILLTSQIDVRQTADRFEFVHQTNQKADLLNNLLTNEPNNVSDPVALQLLQIMLNADGILVMFREKLYTNGIIPEEKEIPQLINWLMEVVQKDVFFTHKLKDHYPGAESINAKAAGLCFMAFGPDLKNGIIWLRQEVKKKINWSGDPSKATQKNDTTNVLSPRKSFEKFLQLVEHQSNEWQKPELDAARTICATLQRQLHLADLKEEEIRYLSLNDKLKKANDELANMNWISTHDLKEPLRKIQIYASMILNKNGHEIPESVRSNINRMQSSAVRMQTLIEDLLAYSKVVDEETRFTMVDLNTVYDEVRAQLSDTIEAKQAVINSVKLPNIRGIHFQMRQLFINLISNALKFAKEDISSIINIGFEQVYIADPDATNLAKVPNYFKIIIADNGIGFNPEYGKKALQIFQRLNGNMYEGTGIGLAICKRIMDNHHGFLEVTGEEGIGATFMILLPITAGDNEKIV